MSSPQVKQGTEWETTIRKDFEALGMFVTRTPKTGKAESRSIWKSAIESSSPANQVWFSR